MILDDGGDATMLVQRASSTRRPARSRRQTEEDPEEWHVFLDRIRKTLADRP